MDSATYRCLAVSSIDHSKCPGTRRWEPQDDGAVVLGAREFVGQFLQKLGGIALNHPILYALRPFKKGKTLRWFYETNGERFQVGKITALDVKDFKRHFLLSGQ